MVGEHGALRAILKVASPSPNSVTSAAALLGLKEDIDVQGRGRSVADAQGLTHGVALGAARTCGVERKLAPRRLELFGGGQRTTHQRVDAAYGSGALTSRLGGEVHDE